MEIQGNVMKVGVVRSGTSGSGNAWRTQEVVIEYFEFPSDMWTQKVVIQLRGNAIDDYRLKVGDKVRLRFGLNYREWEGKFYQEVRIAQDGLQVVSRLGQQTEQTAPEDSTVPASGMENVATDEKKDDLPF